MYLAVESSPRRLQNPRTVAPPLRESGTEEEEEEQEEEEEEEEKMESDGSVVGVGASRQRIAGGKRSAPALQIRRPEYIVSGQLRRVLASVAPPGGGRSQPGSGSNSRASTPGGERRRSRKRVRSRRGHAATGGRKCARGSDAPPPPPQSATPPSGACVDSLPGNAVDRVDATETKREAVESTPGVDGVPVEVSGDRCRPCERDAGSPPGGAVNREARPSNGQRNINNNDSITSSNNVGLRTINDRCDNYSDGKTAARVDPDIPGKVIAKVVDGETDCDIRSVTTGNHLHARHVNSSGVANRCEFDVAEKKSGKPGSDGSLLPSGDGIVKRSKMNGDLAAGSAIDDLGEVTDRGKSETASLVVDDAATLVKMSRAEGSESVNVVAKVKLEPADEGMEKGGEGEGGMDLGKVKCEFGEEVTEKDGMMDVGKVESNFGDEVREEGEGKMDAGKVKSEFGNEVTPKEQDGDGRAEGGKAKSERGREGEGKAKSEIGDEVVRKDGEGMTDSGKLREEPANEGRETEGEGSMNGGKAGDAERIEVKVKSESDVGERTKEKEEGGDGTKKATALPDDDVKKEEEEEEGPEVVSAGFYCSV